MSSGWSSLLSLAQGAHNAKAQWDGKLKMIFFWGFMKNSGKNLCHFSEHVYIQSRQSSKSFDETEKKCTFQWAIFHRKEQQENKQFGIIRNSLLIPSLSLTTTSFHSRSSPRARLPLWIEWEIEKNRQIFPHAVEMMWCGFQFCFLCVCAIFYFLSLIILSMLVIECWDSYNGLISDGILNWFFWFFLFAYRRGS